MSVKLRLLLLGVNVLSMGYFIKTRYSIYKILDENVHTSAKIVKEVSEYISRSIIVSSVVLGINIFGLISVKRSRCTDPINIKDLLSNIGIHRRFLPSWKTVAWMISIANVFLSAVTVFMDLEYSKRLTEYLMTGKSKLGGFTRTIPNFTIAIYTINIFMSGIELFRDLIKPDSCSRYS